jgi:hypothetical protein
MTPYRRHLAYLSYVLHHKWYVFVAGIRLGPPTPTPLMWLIWLWHLIIHDLDKFYPDEWFAYARTFYNPDGSKAKYAETYAFARAWMLHQHRNRHHWQWYLAVKRIDGECVPLPQTQVIVWDRGTADAVRDGAIYPAGLEIVIREAMSPLDRQEMLADWMGAGRAITGKWETPSWYQLNREKMILHPDTRLWLDNQLGVIAP